MRRGRYGNERTFVSQGSASGLGDVIVRGKETLFKKAHGGLAVGVGSSTAYRR